MTIILNRNSINLPDTVRTVAELVEYKRLPATGLAVAINNCVVPKGIWAVTTLNPLDKVTIITAVCGG